MINKILSLIVATIYVASAYYSDGGDTAFRVGIVLIFPIAFIWGGQILVSRNISHQTKIRKSNTLGYSIIVVGWLLLFIPLLISIIFGLLMKP